MKRILSVLLVAGAVVVAACSERDGASRPLGLTAAGNASGDSIPGRKPGPVASVTVSPESATVNVGDSAGCFADLRDAAGSPARDANVKWSVADPTVARIEGAFGQSVILVPSRAAPRQSPPRAMGRAARRCSWSIRCHRRPRPHPPAILGAASFHRTNAECGTWNAEWKG